MSVVKDGELCAALDANAEKTAMHGCTRRAVGMAFAQISQVFEVIADEHQQSGDEGNAFAAARLSWENFNNTLFWHFPLTSTHAAALRCALGKCDLVQQRVDGRIINDLIGASYLRQDPHDVGANRMHSVTELGKVALGLFDSRAQVNRSAVS